MKKIFLFLIFVALIDLTFSNDSKISKLEKKIDDSFMSFFKKSEVDWALIESSYFEYIGQYDKKFEKGKLKFEYWGYKDFWLHNRGSNIHYYVCDSIKRVSLIKNIERIGLRNDDISNTIIFLKSIYEPFMNKKWQNEFKNETIVRIGNTLIRIVKDNIKYASYNDFMGYLIHKLITEIDMDKNVIQKTLIIAGFPDVVYNMTKCKE